MTLWIVGLSLGMLNTWEFVGVFDNEEQAAAACKSYRYFIAPITLNQVAPEAPTEWVGLRWPFGEMKQ